ncbi:MAG TPA: nitroreductase family protein [Deltaproteobacteria bacterium]|nr:nitroreductase family protein [Deltaproteobacteria bacterium]
MADLLQELVRLQEAEGWLSPEALASLAERLRVPLHRLEGLSTFYSSFRREPPAGTEVGVCRDLSCRLAGAESACARLREWASERGGVVIRERSCLGRCDRAPAATIGHAIVDAGDLAAVADRVASRNREPVVRSPGIWPDVEADEAGRTGGADYRVLRDCLRGPRDAPIRTLEVAGLRGMGGAGFPTGRKWSLVADQAGDPKHVVCNADESEPGTFKDRELIHDLPHLLLEGMAIAAFCIGARRGTVFIRHEYEAERRRLEAAIERARSLGALGNEIFGSDFSFDVDVFVSPGGYVLGEETALLECMEGRRGEPRNKPPYPGVAGLHGQPTLINNVETLVHAVGIVGQGADWWHGLGRGDCSGHKFMSVSGDVERPGVSLVPVGTTFGELLERHGGMKAGRALLAMAPGGASSRFLGPESLDLEVDFDAVARAGSMLGSGAAVFIAEGRDLLDVGLSVTRFFRNESCGKCVPCRIGCEKAVGLIEKSGGISARTEQTIRALDETMAQTSICGLGQVALGPLLSILDRFPDRVHRVEDG